MTDGDAAQVLASLQAWARHTFEVPDADERETVCQWCPLCQLVAVLRGDRPEVTERLAAAGTAVLAAVRALVEAAAAGASGADPEQPPATGGPRLHKIDLDGPP